MQSDDQVRAVVRLLIAVLCGTALLLIGLILSGSGVDDTAGRAIGTAVAIALFSLTGVAGSNLANRRAELAVFGYVTAGLSAIAFLGALGGIWALDLSDDGERAVWSAVVLAIASGHASLLLASAKDGDSEAVRLTRAGTLLALGMLSLLAIVEISSSGEDVGAKPIAVVAVLYVLGTILLPLLRRGSRTGRERAGESRAASDGEARVLRLDHVVVAVSDWGRADLFYREVLGGRRVDGPDGRVAYEIGEQRLNVHGPGTSAGPLPLRPVQPGNSDLCFVWNGSIGEAIEHLGRHSVEIVAGPVTRAGAHGIGQSVYVNDPDGSLIELIAYG